MLQQYHQSIVGKRKITNTVITTSSEALNFKSEINFTLLMNSSLAMFQPPDNAQNSYLYFQRI
jgi:hypothetical protein